jgi:ribosomal protein S18 acetylase RimI-like enzyme
MHKLSYRKANREDLQDIINLLADDDLGKDREVSGGIVSDKYKKTFEQIDKDTNQYMMVIELECKVIATCHMTIMPSLTFHASTRMNIEAVRVSKDCQGQKVGQYMFQRAIEYAKSQDVSIIQLSTNKQRTGALVFYKSLGFEDSHEGMKLYL